jgi:hypothetical protein
MFMFTFTFTCCWYCYQSETCSTLNMNTIGCLLLETISIFLTQWEMCSTSWTQTFMFCLIMIISWNYFRFPKEACLIDWTQAQSGIFYVLLAYLIVDKFYHWIIVCWTQSQQTRSVFRYYDYLCWGTNKKLVHVLTTNMKNAYQYFGL